MSHTHWDREWYLPSRYTRRWLGQFFRSLLDRCRADKSYSFHLDGQTILLEDLQEPELLPALKDTVRRGQIALGPYYQQPDWNLASGESLIRNLLIGLRDARSVGEPCMVGWLPDSFGQIAQTAQIHRLFGIRFLTVWRGVPLPPQELACELSWKSPDGTRALTSYLVDSYRNAMQIARMPELAATRLTWATDRLAPFARSGLQLLLNGYDQERHPEDIPGLLRELQKTDTPLPAHDVRQSSLEQYFAELEQWQIAGGETTEVTGSMYAGRYISVFPGVLSARTYLKVFNFRCQTLLSRYIEPLAALRMRSAPPEWRSVVQEQLERLWRRVLRNHPHDSICGVSVDPVHADMEHRFSAIETECLAFAAHLLPPGQNLIVNPSATPRDLVLDDAVYTVPALSVQPRANLTPKADPPGLTVEEQTFRVSNRFYEACVERDGTLSLTSADGAVKLQDLCAIADDGDAGDTYNYSPTAVDSTIRSGTTVTRTMSECGACSAAITVEHRLNLPQRLSQDRSTRSERTEAQVVTVSYRFSAVTPVVGIHVEMTNTVRDHRLRMLFPTDLTSAELLHETQFAQDRTAFERDAVGDDDSLPPEVARVMLGARERDPNTQAPMQRYAAVRRDGDTRGCAVYGRGVHEVEPISDRRTIAVTLLRSVGWLARPDLSSRIGDAGPLMFTPDAQCIRRLSWELGLSAGDCSDEALLRHAEEFCCPVWIPRTMDGAHQHDPGAALAGPDVRGHVGVSGVKIAEDGAGYVLRLWNGTSTPQAVRIHEPAGIRFAETLMADEQRTDTDALACEPETDGDTIDLTILPWKIVSVRIIAAEVALSLPELADTSGRVRSPFEAIRPVADRAHVDAPLDDNDLQAELDRLRELKATLVRLRPKAPKDPDLTDTDGLALQSQISSLERASVEAEISYEINRFRLEAWRKGNRLPEREPAPLFDRLCELGDTLNEARVSKRLDDYVLDLSRAGRGTRGH